MRSKKALFYEKIINAEKDYVNKKYPQSLVFKKMRKTVDIVDKLFAKQVFSDFYDISGPHSYQQVIGDTIL